MDLWSLLRVLGGWEANRGTVAAGETENTNQTQFLYLVSAKVTPWPAPPPWQRHFQSLSQWSGPFHNLHGIYPLLLKGPLETFKGYPRPFTFFLSSPSAGQVLLAFSKAGTHLQSSCREWTGLLPLSTARARHDLHKPLICTELTSAQPVQH